jgi:DNA-binding SARP family transcriptional activator
MRFRVLGPVEFRAGGGELVQLAAPKQRTLLAALILAANRPVSLDRLADTLWPERRPRSVASLLRTYVSALRARLGLELAGDPGIHGVPGGYLFRVDPADLDLLTFEQLADAGAAALASDSPAVAADRLRAAVQLWRGQPFEDVSLDGGWTAELARLAERRLAAQEGWIEARLALGQHRDVVAELGGLVAEQPMRERLWELWMLALYRCGRQAEALNAFRGLRGQLVRELGVEPTAPLQLLHRRILAGDPTLAPVADATEPAGNARPVPRQLPSDVGSFAGRAAELAMLQLVLRPGRPTDAVRVCAVDGVAGIGKSALAVRAAHRLADRFPDGQLYANLQGATAGLAPTPAVVVLGRFLRSLGVEAAELSDVDEAAARFRAAVSGRRLLVVLDDARDAAQVRPLLPGDPGCAALVTSRSILSTLDAAVHLRLDTLATNEAVELIGRLAGEARVAASPAATTRVVELCGQLPLALRIAGARLAARPHWPVQMLADRLSDTQRRLDELEIDDLGIRASFQVSYQLLRSSRTPGDRLAADAFPLLGLPDGPDLGLAGVARLLDLDDADAEQAIDRLVDAQLVECTTTGRYRLHDLLRLFAREHAEDRLPPEVGSAALTRLLDLYLDVATRARRLIAPDGTDAGLAHPDASPAHAQAGPRTPAEAMDWFEAERTNLVTGIDQAARLGLSPHLPIGLAHKLYPFFLRRGPFRDWIHVNRAAQAVARRAGDRLAEALAGNNLTVSYALHGRYQEAFDSVNAALAIFVELGDQRGQARALNHIGRLNLRFLDQPAAAVEALRRSEQLSRALADRSSLTDVLYTLSLAYSDLDHDDSALDCLREALSIVVELGDISGEANLLSRLGEVHQRLGNLAEALIYAQDGLDVARRAGDRIAEAEAELVLTDLLGRLDRHAEAVAAGERGLAIFQQLGDRHGQAKCLRQLGAAARALGEPARSRAHWQAALTICDELGLPEAADVRAELAGTPTH